MVSELTKKKNGLKKLKRLAEFLMTNVERKKFIFSSFAKFTDVSMYTSSSAERTCSANHKCCTKACALGWATTIWPKHLKLSTGYYGTDVILINSGYEAGYENFEAAEQFFDITYDEAIDLFAPNEKLGKYATPKQVAKNILKFVKQKEKELTNEKV